MIKFDKELNNLREYVIEAGDMILEALRNARVSLINGDMEIANQVIDNDRNVNRISYKIESVCLKILLLEHPVATDLRIVSATLKIATDLERIGDQAKDICDLLKFLLEGNIYKDKMDTIIEMSNIIEEMVENSLSAFGKKDFELSKKVIEADDKVENSLSAFGKKDFELSKKVIEADDKVDKLFYKVRDSMVDLIKSGANNCDQAIYLMMIAKYFEKMGDHAENIAKWVYYYSTGDRYQ